MVNTKRVLDVPGLALHEAGVVRRVALQLLGPINHQANPGFRIVVSAWVQVRLCVFGAWLRFQGAVRSQKTRDVG